MGNHDVMRSRREAAARVRHTTNLGEGAHEQQWVGPVDPVAVGASGVPWEPDQLATGTADFACPRAITPLLDSLGKCGVAAPRAGRAPVPRLAT